MLTVAPSNDEDSDLQFYDDMGTSISVHRAKYKVEMLRDKDASSQVATTDLFGHRDLLYPKYIST